MTDHSIPPPLKLYLFISINIFIMKIKGDHGVLYVHLMNRFYLSPPRLVRAEQTSQFTLPGDMMRKPISSRGGPSSCVLHADAELNKHRCCTRWLTFLPEAMASLSKLALALLTSAALCLLTPVRVHVRLPYTCAHLALSRGRGRWLWTRASLFTRPCSKLGSP